ncbi:uncharacterized protein LOC113214819 [Frankliniella occidentalis]|uniref:Uncharacterized protein LOC113214819 n=1 Tax=Frankliniella occidentalis TaxID=133901 RepID=A0A6J1T9X3_FRAOC|nr:uncharacterized protein LOC113214819 [Frankliniella occidentalis]
MTNTIKQDRSLGELRAIADAARAGLQKFQSLMNEASALIDDVDQKIGILCSELASVEQPSNLLASSSAPTTRTSSSPVGPNTSSVVASVHNKDSSGTSTLTQGTARPMVQGRSNCATSEISSSCTLRAGPAGPPEGSTSKSPSKRSRGFFESEESSSEDKDNRLLIVESKKSYLERQRQEDCKEGTSWNYDNEGNFHKSPPRKRRSKQAKSPTSPSHGDAVNSSNSDKTADQLNELSSVTRSLGTIETPMESDVTLHDITDMSLTLTSNLKKLVNNQESGDETPRRKSSASDDLFSSRIGSPSLLNINITASAIEKFEKMEDVENTPPILRQHSVTCDKIFSHHKEVIPANHQELSPRASSVAYERLPSNIISGNITPTPVICTDSVILKEKKKCTAPDKASKQNEASCASESNLENKHASSPITPDPKLSLPETQITPIRTGSIDAQFNGNKRPGYREAKKRRKI